MARLRGCGLQCAARGPHPRVGRTFQPDNSDADLRKQALEIGQRLGYLEEASLRTMLDAASEIARMIHGLLRSPAANH